MGILSYAATRLDSWVNLITSVGGSQSRTAFSYQSDLLLNDYELESMYEGDPFVSRICRVIPEESLRQGFAVKTGNRELDEWVKGRLEELQAASKLLEGWTWARLYGGGGVVLGASDGRDPSEPLDYTTIESVPFLVVFDKRELRPTRWYGDRSQADSEAFQSPSEASFGEPSHYELTRSGGSNTRTQEIHASRIIRFDGALTSRTRKRANYGWSLSEIQRIYTSLQTFNGAWASAAALFQDTSQGVFHVKGLTNMMAGDLTDAVKMRLRMLDLSRSMTRSILVDADGEDYTRTESSAIGGLPGAIDKFVLLLAGAAEMPATILIGQAPAGLNATGDSDIRWFYDRIRSGQQNYLKRRLEKLVRVLLRSKNNPVSGIEPRGWTIEFKSLWQMTEKEDAELRKTTADTDAVYLTNQVITPEEVGLSRFRDTGWSRDTTISLKARREAQQADLEASEGNAGLAAGKDQAGSGEEPESPMRAT
jgi:uncharacterized protein